MARNHGRKKFFIIPLVLWFHKCGDYCCLVLHDVLMCIYVCAHMHTYMPSKKDGDSAGSPDGKKVTCPELFLQEWW